MTVAEEHGVQSPLAGRLEHGLVGKRICLRRCLRRSLFGRCTVSTELLISTCTSRNIDGAESLTVSVRFL